MLAVAGTVGVGALAGCLGGLTGGGSSAPDPVTLTNDDACDVCGMVIPAHPGPDAEIVYPKHRPNGHDNPAHFDSTWEAFQFDFDRRKEGWKRSAFYVTDYSSVDYQLLTQGGETFISTHPEASAFADAEGVTFVVGSGVKGAMGKDLIPFSARGDAASFRKQHGGTLATFGDVTPTMIDQLGQS